MIVGLDRAPGCLAPILTALLMGPSLLGGTLAQPGPELAAPWALANNGPDPQVRLAGAIVMIFVGCLALLALGHVVDSIRSANPPVPRCERHPDGAAKIHFHLQP
jgi:hypothetical protein